MKRLNPLYLIFLSLTILFISFFILEDEKVLINNSLKDYTILKTKALSYKDYKDTWNNQSYVEKTVNRILSSSKFKNIKITKNKTKKLLKLKVESISPNILNSFLNKLLNKNVNINKLELNKKYIYVEVGLK